MGIYKVRGWFNSFPASFFAPDLRQKKSSRSCSKWERTLLLLLLLPRLPWGVRVDRLVNAEGNRMLEVPADGDDHLLGVDPHLRRQVLHRRCELQNFGIGSRNPESLFLRHRLSLLHESLQLLGGHAGQIDVCHFSPLRVGWKTQHFH